MKTRMVEECEGEFLGPVDWSYNFAQHDWSGGNGGVNPAVMTRGKETLRLLSMAVERGEKWLATVDGGVPRIGYKRVVHVGMYDGWPFWRPTPSVALAGHFGLEWHPFYSITDATPTSGQAPTEET